MSLDYLLHVCLGSSSEGTIMILTQQVKCMGIFVCRFSVSGVHPASKMPGTFTETPYDKKSTSELVSTINILCKALSTLHCLDVTSFNYVVLYYVSLHYYCYQQECLFYISLWEQKIIWIKIDDYLFFQIFIQYMFDYHFGMSLQNQS